MNLKNQNQNWKGQGRVKGGPDLRELFSMYDRIPVVGGGKRGGTGEGGVGSLGLGGWESNNLMEAFLSAENKTLLQNGIRQGVYERSKGRYVIGQQDDTVLTTIMRSIYLQYSRNRETGIPEQIRRLNNYVLDYAVPQVHGEAQAIRKYEYDISHGYQLMQPPQMIVKKEGKELQLSSWF